MPYVLYVAWGVGLQEDKLSALNTLKIQKFCSNILISVEFWQGEYFMIKKVGTVSLFVNDQDAAKAFYTEKLGFEVVRDVPFGPDYRWLEVVPPGAETSVILYKPDENWEHYRQVVGKSQALTLDVTGIDALVADLQAKGVRVPMGIMDEMWGRHAFILDHEDNMLLLVEQPTQG